MFKQFLAAVAAAATGVAAVSHAAPVFIISGAAPKSIPFVFPANNNFPWVVGKSGTVGGFLTLSEDGFVSAEYLGKEAGFANNQFLWRGSVIFATGSGSPMRAPNPIPATPTVLAGPVALPGPVAALSPLPFAFRANGGANGTVINTEYDAIANPNGNSATRAVDFAFLRLAGDPLSTLYLLFDDGGAGNDDDHDDMIVRLTVQAVPEPGSLALLAAGLMMVTAVAVRRTRVAKR